jgi:hypothetical protein
VDWTPLSSGYVYIFSSSATVTIAEEIVDLIITFVRKGYLVNLDQVRFIGFSLGAHISGIVGSKINEIMGLTLPRIDGMIFHFDNYLITN